MEKIYWSLLSNNEWQMYIAATEKGLCYVGSQNQPFSELLQWVAKKYPTVELEEGEAYLEPYKKELIEYLSGARQTFTIAFDYSGTVFQQAVWEALAAIPYGTTMGYAEIATKINKPKSVRAVGTAIGANPILIVVPCHRVIGKNGKLTGYRGGLEMKEKLLQLEKNLLVNR
ncbi:MAG: methylated-DNA--[protein]-cysteine S-methyltransferase [Bacillus sp. (in: firmicutes)]